MKKNFLPCKARIVLGVLLGLTGSGCRSVTSNQTATAARRAALQEDMRELDTAIAPLSMSATASALGDKGWVEIPVPFATRRRPTGDATPDLFYGIDDGPLQYGLATVSIPATHRPGKDDSRGWCRHLPGALECSKTPSNAVMVAEIKPLGSDGWLTLVRALVDSTGSPRHVLVFVHGFNNGFADAIRRIAQLSYDVGFKGVTLAYDWSSRHQVAQYTVDEATMERSVPDFERFLTRIVDSTGATGVSVVAHSMGTRLVAYAMRDLHYVRPNLKLDQVILAAGDIDLETFSEQLAGPLVSTSNWVTLYASSRDRAIQASRALHNAKRVGSGPLPAITRTDMDYIDASQMDTDLLGHGYFAENRDLITDVFLVLKHGLPASERNLVRVGQAPANYFRFR